MLFDDHTLAGIERGDITVAFRRWERTRVRVGTRMRTRVGLVEVVAVSEVDPEDIGDDDVARAGFPGRRDLEKWIEARPGRLYRIELRFAGADPRVALREDADLDAEDLAEL